MVPNQPNILCISIDSLRRDFCSIYTESEDTTPFLNSISDELTIFQNAISPSCWTLQVHGSVFTGLYPPEHGVLDKNNSLGDHPTFAELLSRKGYDTQSFGYNGWFEAGDILRGFNHTPTDPFDSSISKTIKRRIRQLSRTESKRDELSVKNVHISLDQSLINR